MNTLNVKKSLQKLLKSPVKINVPLFKITSYKCGGLADIIVYPHTIKELSSLIKYIRKSKYKFFIIGNCTNIIAQDHGFRGILISLKKFNTIRNIKNSIICEAGVDLDDLVMYAITHGMKGLENLSWIPGTVGGALRMNAGAFNREIAQSIQKIQIMHYNGSVRWITQKDAGFGYRTAKNLENKIIISAVFRLNHGKKPDLIKQRSKIIRLRKEKQPLNYASAGSVFKRPPGYFAGALITQAGLKGYRIGDAQVSEKHAGFIVNRGKATSSDIIRLIKHIQKKIKNTFNIQLELEQVILD